MSKVVVIGADVPKTSEPIVAKPIAPTPSPDKRVILTSTNGQWKAEVELNNVNTPFTERDFNQLVRVLSIQRHVIRRESSLAYRRLLNQPPVSQEPLKA